MRKHIYGDITYGMRYKQYLKILSQKMQLARKCKGYEEFKEDVALLRKTRKDCGKPTILANWWMRKICNFSKAEIIKFVDNYKKGMLDPYKLEPKERNMEKETGYMDEEEDEIDEFMWL